MPRELTVGVLTPHLGGGHYGALLDAITRAAAASHATVVAIQTLNAAPERIDVAEPADLPAPVAWEHVAGFLVLDRAVGPGYLAALREAGKPVVAVGDGARGPEDPMALGRTAVAAFLAQLRDPTTDGTGPGGSAGSGGGHGDPSPHRDGGPPAEPPAPHDVVLDLLRPGQGDPRELGWLRRTSVRAGVLGLWAEGRCDAHADATLELAGTFVRGRGADAVAGDTTSTRHFPPPELLALAAERPDDLVQVVPVAGGGSDWGLLAVVDAAEPDATTGRDRLNHWAALLTVALDHRAVQRELRDQQEQLRVAARYDHLTGLANRSLFLCRVDAAIEAARHRPDHRYAVIFVDLDGFKVINDSLGHSAGDRLLIQVAERIKTCLREPAVTARLSADEFVVLLDGIEDPAAPTRVAERLHATLARPFQLQGREVVATATIGIAFGEPRYEHAEDLVRDADIAMCWSKSRRKGSHAVFDVTMHARAVSRLQIETELRRAVERDEFEVHYQPIVDLPTGKVHAFEALVRWRHPERGLVQPDDFLPIAEETGLILPIGQRMLDEVCRRVAAWQRDIGRPDLSVSLNISNRQFWHGGLVDDVARSLHDSGLTARSLSLEITEGVIMHNVGLARKLLKDLHGLGCRLHIDDFGTGYSSLEALHRLPIDALKIDRSFVSGLGVDPRSGELVRTIVLMGRNLGLDLIGEGIENAEQREHLLRLDCTYGQGYLLSRPVPAEPAAALVTRRH
ncbi:diguanylate cyclase (GGDEF) domain-containing protein [Micromonospora pattaloongensis]|uniref:Diguanylate cyclase (GGDEF) domain-containing protein n=1 Tax=Micromonospora pattaloongensis TaxID=405436 RepID=A0A1H3KU03_9ACTN|nr:EAL domain-containing protein [Micromonospora pattaloongensis]SDY55652.1 diguanylate cyclase (GGDEF) domain-containing protein [Micromonospora pattaloongensis]